MNELKEQIIEKCKLYSSKYGSIDDLESIMQLIETYTAKKESEARIDELYLFMQEPNSKDNYFVKRITQLSSQLTNNKEGIENDKSMKELSDNLVKFIEQFTTRKELEARINEWTNFAFCNEIDDDIKDTNTIILF